LRPRNKKVPKKKAPTPPPSNFQCNPSPPPHPKSGFFHQNRPHQCDPAGGQAHPILWILVGGELGGGGPSLGIVVGVCLFTDPSRFENLLTTLPTLRFQGFLGTINKQKKKNWGRGGGGTKVCGRNKTPVSLWLLCPLCTIKGN